MARERSDKGKNKPLDKPEGRKEKVRTGRTGKSDEGVSTSAEPTEEVTSENPTRPYSVQPAARSQKRQERQRIAEPAADLRESKKFLEQTPRTNGGPSIEDDSVTHRRIAERAFILFQESGCEHGNDWSHWFEAERQINETQV